LQDLSLHILDIVENSITAGAKHVEIAITEDLEKDSLSIEIMDDGKGMDKSFVKKATSPFVSTRTERRVGFGLSLLAQAARMSNGSLTIHSEPYRGTKVKAVFQYSHIDRQPLGNIGDTLLTLIVGNPHVEFVYRHQRGVREFNLCSRDLRVRLEDLLVVSPQGLRSLREKLKQDFH